MSSLTLLLVSLALLPTVNLEFSACEWCAEGWHTRCATCRSANDPSALIRDHGVIDGALAHLGVAEILHYRNDEQFDHPRLPVTVVVAHREFVLGCHTFERFIDPRWTAIFVFEAAFERIWDLKALVGEAVRTTAGAEVRLALLGPTVLTTGEWLARAVAVRVLEVSKAGTAGQPQAAPSAPLLLSSQCDIHPLPQWHAMYIPFHVIVDRMVRAFLDESERRRAGRISWAEPPTDWIDKAMSNATCMGELNISAASRRPLFAMNTVMVETIPDTDSLAGARFHALDQGAYESGFRGLDWFRRAGIPSGSTWLSDNTPWFEDHFALYNLTLLGLIAKAMARASETVSEGVRVLPRMMCRRGWSAARHNDLHLFYDLAHESLTSDGSRGKRLLYDHTKYTQIDEAALQAHNLKLMGKRASPLGCMREFANLKAVMGSGTCVVCAFSSMHLSKSHVGKIVQRARAAHPYRVLVRHIEDAVIPLLQLQGYEWVGSTPTTLYFAQMPALHTRDLAKVQRQSVNWCASAMFTSAMFAEQCTSSECIMDSDLQTLTLAIDRNATVPAELLLDPASIATQCQNRRGSMLVAKESAMNERVEAICRALSRARTQPDPPQSYVPLAAALWPACNAAYSLPGTATMKAGTATVKAGTAMMRRTAARTEDANDTLTGLVVYDSATGTDSVFRLLRQDAPRAAEVADLFCDRMHLDSRVSCKETIKAHLQATGHLAKPSISGVSHLSSVASTEAGHPSGAAVDRRRVTRNATIIAIGDRPGAQTIQQLVRQMYLSKSPSYSSTDIRQVMLAHRLSASLCGDMWRADGRPLDTHLVATASIAVSFGQPLQAVLVMLLHSVSLFAKDVPRPELKRLLYESGVQFWHETIDVLVHWMRYREALHAAFQVADRSSGNAVTKGTLAPPLLEDMVVLEAINDIDEYQAGYLVGFELLELRPWQTTEVLARLGAGSLGSALEVARARLRSMYAEAPAVWQEVAELDLVPGQHFSFRLDSNMMRAMRRGDFNNGGTSRKAEYTTGRRQEVCLVCVCVCLCLGVDVSVLVSQ